MAKSKVYELAIKINGKLDSSLKKACAAAAQNLETVGNAAKTAGKVVAGASAAIVGATATMGAAAVNAAAEYQTKLANISTLLTGTEAEVAARTAEIGDQVLEISNKTGVATDNLTDGMYQVISAFGDSADAASILETAAKSAAAGNATTADSINLLSAVTKGYGDTSAAAVQKAADLSFATVRLGQTSFPELAASMGKVIPLAGTLGLEQEQLFGAMATLTGVTGSTAEVVTQLKVTMQGFLSPSKNMLGMGNVKLALIAAVIASVAAGFVLLWNKSEKFRETVMVLWGQLQTLGGALADMAGAIWAKAAPLLEMLGNALLNGLERAVDLLAPVAGNILGIFTGIADFITGVFTGDWDKALQGLQNIFGNALSGLGNLAVAGFTAILEIGTSIWPAIDNAVQAGIAAISSRFPVLGAVLGSLWSTVQKVWSNIQVILQNAIQFVQNVFAGNWSGAWQNIVNIFGAIFGTVASIAMAPMNMLANGVQAAINSVAAFLSEKFPFLGALFSGWAASISAAIENIKAIFSGIIDFVQNVFSGNWSAAWQNIVDIFGNLFGMIVNLAKAPINGVISAINFVLEKINGISVTIPDWVPGVGGTTLGFNIPTIPQLATGGIVTAPTILEAGEGGEAEAILPLSKLAAMLQSVANAPEITDLGNQEDGPEEAPLAQLAKMLDDWTRNNKPDPHGPGQGGGGRDLPDPPRPGGNDAPPPAGGQNPPGGGVDTITFAPVFNFYGPTTPEQAKEAGQISFAEFKRMYDRMKAEERRKNLSASTR